jgi:drug/metabolite transporter (DMT)-like permease
MTIGFLYAFGAALSWSIAGFYITRIANHLPIPLLNAIRLIIGLVILLPIAAILESNHFFLLFSSSYSLGWLWLSLSGITGLVLGDLFSFKSYAILQPQKASIITTLSPATALLFGAILLNEKINTIGIIGICITIFGVMGISLGRTQLRQSQSTTHGTVSVAVMYGIGAAACHGLALAFSKKAFVIQKISGFPIDPFSASFIRLFAGLILAVAIIFISRKPRLHYEQLQNNKKLIWQTGIAAIFNPVLAVTFSMLSILYLDVAVAQTIFSFVPLFTALISFFILKEKVSLPSLLGIFIAIIGVSLLIWREQIWTLIS